MFIIIKKKDYESLLRRLEAIEKKISGQEQVNQGDENVLDYKETINEWLNGKDSK